VTVKLDPQSDGMAALWKEAKALGIHAPWIGTTGGAELKLGKARAIPVAELKSAHESWFPRFMEGDPTL
jgi:cytochrome oxidase Cu insertion factor (SCO1/SenC/PrrC family)